MGNMNDKGGSFIPSTTPQDAGDARSKVNTNFQPTNIPPSSHKMYFKVSVLKYGDGG